jgi:hypothetical protein
MEFIVFVLITALTIIPLYKLLPRFGVSQYWAFAAVIPLGVLVLLWVMASRADRMDRTEAP